MNNWQKLPRLLALAVLLQLLACALFAPTGQIIVQVVSWPLVKELAEPNAGLPDQTIPLRRVQDQRLVTEQITDSSGILVFKLPAGDYLVQGVGQMERVNVQAGQIVRLKLIKH